MVSTEPGQVHDAEQSDLHEGNDPDQDGAPKVGPTARALGVRPDEISVDGDGRALPGTGGMSVSPDSVWNLPNHRRPRGMGRGSTGPASDRVYAIREDALTAHALRGEGMAEPSFRTA